MKQNKQTKKETITINISKDTHLKLLEFQNYIYRYRGEKWKFDTIISALINFYKEK